MDLAARLRADARAADERRVLVLAGTAERTRQRVEEALEAAAIDPADARYVGRLDSPPVAQVDPRRSDQLLGTTRQAVVVDCHDACRPNALGAALGAVDGGGLLVLLTPPLDEWPDRRDDFDETLAVPPFDVGQVIGYFRRRLVQTLRDHRGIAIIDVADEQIVREGIVDGPPGLPRRAPAVPADAGFPTAAYEAALTQDQADALSALEVLREDGQAVVVEADRGRGKSSAVGLAAASLAAEGADVLVTAPNYRNAGEVFARARELLSALDELAGVDDETDPHCIETAAGRVRFARPADATALPGDPDCVVVDEAAALPVRVLDAFLGADSVVFATTVHGYEGAGRGFSVRFRERLDDDDHELTDVTLPEPIRYAPADPIEVWCFRALALDARPAVDPLVTDATPEETTYRQLSSADLLENEHLLREVFGLLVLAHYRTEPDDLARLLDAPNVTARALLSDGHVVSVALLAREGGLPADIRARMYEGHRVRGNMIPDVLPSQLRDEAVGVPVGYRVLRIATHPAVRSQGRGSRLLSEIRAELAGGDPECDYLGVGYGATPELVDFWSANDFSAVHLSTTRNDRSGEHSVVMLDPLSDAGRDLHQRHTDWFLRRLPGMLTDALSTVDPDVIRATLSAVDATPPVDCSEMEWRVAVGAAEGAGIVDAAPDPVRRLALRHLVAPADPDALSDRQERLLVCKGLQARDWDVVAEGLDYHSTGQCKRALGESVGTLVECYGSEFARQERERL
jgi:tRNA(Met) cytidine acetyltransferase